MSNVKAKVQKYQNKPFKIKLRNGKTLYAKVMGVEGNQVKIQISQFRDFGNGFSFLFPLLFFFPFFGGLFDGFGD